MVASQIADSFVPAALYVTWTSEGGFRREAPHSYILLYSTPNPAQATKSKGQTFGQAISRSLSAMSVQQRALLGKLPSEAVLAEAIIAGVVASPSPSPPEVKVYSDSVFFNFYALGISILAAPLAGYKPNPAKALDATRLRIQSIDIFNSDSKKNTKYAPFSSLSLVFPTHPELLITASTNGKDFVQHLGEPERKGGGEGPSSGMGIWCEWPKEGVMVEFDAQGPQAWERGKDAKWICITIFEPSA